MSTASMNTENKAPSAPEKSPDSSECGLATGVSTTTEPGSVAASSKPSPTSTSVVPATLEAKPVAENLAAAQKPSASSVVAAAPTPVVSAVGAVSISKPVSSAPPKQPMPVPELTATASTIPATAPSTGVSQSKPKSKKKKGVPPTVTMATAPTATSGGPGAQGENTGRWTAEEHRLFLQGLEQHGKGWKKIASLIKSRTVVQIRTHAQKYFQKLAKARQNGEEGDVAMEGRGGATSVASGGVVSNGVQSSKRRRQTTGTKRKAISSVVASAQRHGKKMAAAQAAAGVSCPKPPLPAVAPALAPFVVPNAVPQQSQPTGVSMTTTMPSITTSHGTISGPALEDSLFRFLTPAPVTSAADPTSLQVNDVARQAGANPITVPTDNPAIIQSSAGGEVSPTGVTDIAVFPSWTDTNDLPSWYAKGADVDALLDCADTLDWLADTGDLHETYKPPGPPTKPSTTTAPPQIPLCSESEQEEPSVSKLEQTTSVTSLTGPALHSEESVVPPLPSLFENSDHSEPRAKSLKEPSSDHLTDTPDAEASAIEEHLNVFDTPMEEHAFVSALLENNGESSGSLPVLS